MRTILSMVVAASVAGCWLPDLEQQQPTKWDIPWGDPDGGTADACVHDATMCQATGDAGAPKQLDVLFVIDDSRSMAEEQASLRAKFHAFIERLEQLPGGLPSVHIGVVLTDLGTSRLVDKGCNQTGGKQGILITHGLGCELQGRFISDEIGPDGARVKNYKGTLGQAFSCVAALGINGCGWEQPLAAMKRALDGSRPENAGFLRKDAHLAVIIIADEDDCSASSSALYATDSAGSSPLSIRCFDEGVVCDPDLPYTNIGVRQHCRSNEGSTTVAPVASYVDFLLGLKGGDREKIVVAAVIGKAAPIGVVIDENLDYAVAPSCRSANGLAHPGIRLTQFVSKFGRHGAVSSICSADLAPALRQIGDICAAQMSCNPR